MVFLLGELSNTTLQQLRLPRQTNSQRLQASDLDVWRKLNIANTFIESIPILAVVVGKPKSLEKQIVQLLTRAH